MMAETTAARKSKKEKTKPNVIALTPDQRVALHFQHVDKIAAMEKEVAAATGRLRAARKTAKGDLGEEGLAEIDTAIWLESDEGQAEMRAEMERMVRVAAWHGADVGQQVSFLDALPARNFKNEGKLAGLRGLTAKPPDGLGQADAQLWLEGWHLGQAVLVEGFGKTDAVEKEAHADEVKRQTKAAAEAAGAPAGDDERDLRPPYARPENQQHPKDKPKPKEGEPPAIGTAPSTIKQVH